jgi:hypothetical protein
MRIPQTKPQKLKALVHAVQALFIFVAGCLSLAVLTMSGGSSGTMGYMFGLVSTASKTLASTIR